MTGFVKAAGPVLIYIFFPSIPQQHLHMIELFLPLYLHVLSYRRDSPKVTGQLIMSTPSVLHWATFCIHIVMIHLVIDSMRF